MCCISAPIKVVGSTKIFCAPNSDNTRQVTVYENVVDNVTQNNIMILPVPFPDTVEFHNLSEYSKFFNDCSKSFVTVYPTNNFLGTDGQTYTNEGDVVMRGKSALKVIDVGSYKVSLANNLEDLNNLDEKHFVLTKEVYKFMKKHYNYGFMGFVVCKLVLGNKEYHPIAYSHNIYKKKIFIPTKHFHMHEHVTDGFNGFNHYGFMSDVLIDKPKTIDDGSYADDWHHDIYIYNGNIGKNAKLDAMIKKTISDPKGSAGIHYEWSKDITFNFDKIDFNLGKKCREFQKFQIIGRHPNIDLITYVA